MKWHNKTKNVHLEKKHFDLKAAIRCDWDCKDQIGQAGIPV